MVRGEALDQDEQTRLRVGIAQEVLYDADNLDILRNHIATARKSGTAPPIASWGSKALI